MRPSLSQPPKHPNNIGTVIKRHGWKLDQVATQTGIPRRTLIDYCQGRTAVPKDRREKLAACLSYPASYLVPRFREAYLLQNQEDQAKDEQALLALQTHCKAHPTDENALRELMVLLAMHGHPEEIGQYYARLLRELNQFTSRGPEPSTSALVEELCAPFAPAPEKMGQASPTNIAVRSDLAAHAKDAPAPQERDGLLPPISSTPEPPPSPSSDQKEDSHISLGEPTPPPNPNPQTTVISSDTIVIQTSQVQIFVQPFSNETQSGIPQSVIVTSPYLLDPTTQNGISSSPPHLSLEDIIKSNPYGGRNVMDKGRRRLLEGTFEVTQAGILVPVGERLISMTERFAYEPFLEQCRASLPTCKELAQSSDPNDLALAFRYVSGYMVDLETIMNSSSRHRTQALELAAHYAILKTYLGWSCAGNAAALLFAQDAIDISRESGNFCLLLSAYSKRAWAYLYTNQRKLALATASEAFHLLEKYKDPLPTSLWGGTHSTLSVMQARNKLDPDTALKKASEQGPDNGLQHGMVFTEGRLWIEQGEALYYAGKSREALDAYEKIVDPKTLEATKTFKGTLTERERVDTILDMLRASMKGVTRNMENAIRYWEAVLEGAKRLDHKGLYSEALTAHDEMELAFPDEQEVHDLLDHIKPDKASRE